GLVRSQRRPPARSQRPMRGVSYSWEPLLPGTCQRYLGTGVAALASHMATRRPVNMAPLRRTLTRVFKLDRFRPGQEDVIRAVMEGRDAIAVMPTGAGKSLCYQLPALHLPGMTLVVSPLIALMKDQVDKLTELGIEASQLNSTLSAGEADAALDGIARERPEFVLTTPERLADPEF